MRKTIFSNEEIYHLFNRGVEKRPTFTDKRECDRAILTMDYYRYDEIHIALSQVLNLERDRREFFLSELRKHRKLVDILGFCLMINHFHLLLKQLMDNGIKIFISNFSNSYTRYFNTKNDRLGYLFQGAFKGVRIEDEAQFIHVLRYIHVNPVISSIIKPEDLENYQYCSYQEYLGKKEGFCNKELALKHFSSIDGLKNFTYDQVSYKKSLESIQHLILE